jgi:serine/threonine protein kinase
MQIPNYEILETIGEGGFAIVYKARREKGSLLVAIKVPKVPYKNFVKELAVWLQLNHLNIVKLLDYDINPRPYMVMELMNGTLHGKTVTLLRNYSLFLITPKYRFDKLCLYSITEVVFIGDLPN